MTKSTPLCCARHPRDLGPWLRGEADCVSCMRIATALYHPKYRPPVEQADKRRPVSPSQKQARREKGGRP